MSAESTTSGEGRSFPGGMADHLYTRFVHLGLTTPIFGFSEAEDLPMCSRFGSHLLDAIGRYKMWIPILRELVQLAENRTSTGSFWEAFHSHKMCFERRDVETGQQQLRGVSFLKGWESGKMANGYQAELVGIVVETVMSELPQDFRVDVPETSVGIDEIIGLLDSTQTIGIYGMGGIGKIIFTCGEIISCSFILDIRETTKHSSRRCG